MCDPIGPMLYGITYMVRPAIDPVNNDNDYQQLYAEITKTRRGRHFFNPAGSSLLPPS